MSPLLILALGALALFVVAYQLQGSPFIPSSGLAMGDPSAPVDPNTGAPATIDSQPIVDPWTDPFGWLDSFLPSLPGNPGDPLLPQPGGPDLSANPSPPDPAIQTPDATNYPGCGLLDNPAACAPFQTGVTAGTPGAAGAFLPGDPHDYDNQIVYVCSALGMTDVFAPYVLKAICAKETNFNPAARGDHGTCLAVDPNQVGCCAPYRGDGSYAGYASIGIAQVNRCAHAALAASYDLRDPNQCLYAAGVVLLGNYNPADWFGTIRAYNGSGPQATAYATDVLQRARLLAQSAGISGV